MKSLLLLCFLASSLAHFSILSDVKSFVLPPNFENNTASFKQQYLWKQCIANTKSGAFSTPAVAQLFVEPMDASFTPQDTLAGLQGPIGFFNRSKVIHTVGSVAKFRYTSVGKHPYTGIYSGSSVGIVRLSTAAAYDKSAFKTMVPAFVFKFFRDGVPSSNLFGMNSLEGQRDSFNFFKHDGYSNPPQPSLDINAGQKALMKRFMTATNWNMLGNSDAATFDSAGKRVAKPIFPYNIIWQATKNVRNLFPDTFITSYLPDLTAQVPANSPLFNVYAWDPNQKPILMGVVTLDGVLTSSDFGDNHLYFGHIRKEADFALRPDWVPFATAVVKLESNSHYYNGPEDIPYPQ